MFLKDNQFDSNGAWLMKGTQKLLWLPPEYRPRRATSLRMHIAIGTRSGRVFFLHLPPIDNKLFTKFW